MRISLVVAASTNNVIGKDGGLPWHLAGDLRYFKALTMGHPIVMGRATWDSIGRALPGRTSIVLTRQTGFVADGAIVVSSPAAALKAAGDVTDVMVIGGGQVYELFMPVATHVYLTRVHADVEGDTFFPVLDTDRWHLVAREPGSAEEGTAYDIETWERGPQ